MKQFEIRAWIFILAAATICLYDIFVHDLPLILMGLAGILVFIGWFILFWNYRKQELSEPKPILL